MSTGVSGQALLQRASFPSRPHVTLLATLPVETSHMPWWGLDSPRGAPPTGFQDVLDTLVASPSILFSISFSLLLHRVARRAQRGPVPVPIPMLLQCRAPPAIPRVSAPCWPSLWRQAGRAHVCELSLGPAWGGAHCSVHPVRLLPPPASRWHPRETTRSSPHSSLPSTRPLLRQVCLALCLGGEPRLPLWWVPCGVSKDRALQSFM